MVQDSHTSGRTAKDENLSPLLSVRYFQARPPRAITHNGGMKISYPIPNPRSPITIFKLDIRIDTLLVLVYLAPTWN
jgi:hypothetical protein